MLRLNPDTEFCCFNLLWLFFHPRSITFHARQKSDLRIFLSIGLFDHLFFMWFKVVPQLNFVSPLGRFIFDPLRLVLSDDMIKGRLPLLTIMARFLFWRDFAARAILFTSVILYFDYFLGFPNKANGPTDKI